MQAILDAIATGGLDAEIALVLSDIPEAYILERAARAGLPTGLINCRDFRSNFPEEVQHETAEALLQSGVELVCLAGFMRLLSTPFIDHWRDRLINIHPSLLPAYKGLDVHQRVLDAGEDFSGCSVHFVRPEMDTGPIILQAKVPVQPGDDADALAARVLEQEHVIYPEAVRLIADGRVSVDGELAQIDGKGKN